MPSVTNDQKVAYNSDHTDKELLHALKEISNNKSPDNDGLTKELREIFLDELIDSFINSVNLAHQKIT